MKGGFCQSVSLCMTSNYGHVVLKGLIQTLENCIYFRFVQTQGSIFIILGPTTRERGLFEVQFLLKESDCKMKFIKFWICCSRQLFWKLVTNTWFLILCFSLYDLPPPPPAYSKKFLPKPKTRCNLYMSKNSSAFCKLVFFCIKGFLHLWFYIIIFKQVFLLLWNGISYLDSRSIIFGRVFPTIHPSTL